MTYPVSTFTREKRVPSFSLLLLGILVFLFAGKHLFARPFGETTPPRIDRIGPTSFRATWGVWPSADPTTCYQVRIDRALFSPSTLMPTQEILFLKGSRVYQVEVITYHQGQQADISSSAFVLTAAATPTNVIVVAVGTSGFTLNWDLVPTATEYQILIDGTVTQTVSAPLVSAVLAGLTPGRQLTVTVVARNSSGLSNPSKPVFVQLLPPAPLFSVKPEEIGQTAFTIRWKGVDGAASYGVTIDASPTVTVGSATLFYRATGLTPGATHTAKLAVMMPTGQTSEATETRVLLIPATPALPRALGISTSTFLLDWAPVAGAGWYKVYADGDFLIANIPAPLNSVLCEKGFNQGRTASMAVSACNVSGDSPRSPILAVTMLGTPTRGIEEPVRLGDSLRDPLLTTVEIPPGKPVLLFFCNEKQKLDAFARNPDLDGTTRIAVLSSPTSGLSLLTIVDGQGRLHRRLFGQFRGMGLCILDGFGRVRGVDADISPDRIGFRLFSAIPRWNGGNGVWRHFFDRERTRFDGLQESADEKTPR
ncbi:MAG: fibronectin type III domain-containing protein [Candidatus Ozemobacteraceae bacterium]